MNYLDYYELAQEPFSNAPVSRFYFNSPQHSQALVRLTHLCSQMKGLGILVGDIGAGKTTLARRLLDSLPENEYEAALLVIIHSGVTASWLLKRIAQLQGDALEQPGSGHAAVDDHQQGGLVLVLRERIEQPARQRGLPRADVADEDAEPLHLRAEVREPHQGLRVLRRIEVEARDRRVRERLLGQLVVVEIVHQTKPIFRFLRAGSGPGSGELPGRDPAVAGVLVEWAATFLAATAGLDAGRAIGLGVALMLPPSRWTRSATSRKLGSSAWMA